MSSELLYTSAPKGLRQGTRGFCTVISSAGMPSNLASKLESLSGYRQMYAPESADAAKNPVAFSHLTFSLGGQTTSVLSRVAAYGTDYSGRTNKLAHHVVPDRTEQTPSGPAWALQQPGVMRAKWNGECQTTATGPTIPHGQLTPALCQTWQTLTGDAGWAGVLAETWTQRQSKPVWIVFPVEQQASLLQLFVEASALLPQNQRWNATFSTYATQLPPDINCSVRCVVDGTQDARMASARGTVIKLGQTNPSPASSKWVEIARGKQVEAVPTPATTNPVPPTPTPSSPASAGASAPSEPTLAPAIPATPDTHHAAAPPDIQSPPNAAPAISMPVHDASSTTPDLPLQLQPPLGTNPSHQNLTSPTGPNLPPFAGDNAYEIIPEKKFLKSHSTLLATIGGVAVALALIIPTTLFLFARKDGFAENDVNKKDRQKLEKTQDGAAPSISAGYPTDRETNDQPKQEAHNDATMSGTQNTAIKQSTIDPKFKLVSGELEEGKTVEYEISLNGLSESIEATLKVEDTERVEILDPKSGTLEFGPTNDSMIVKLKLLDDQSWQYSKTSLILKVVNGSPVNQVTEKLQIKDNDFKTLGLSDLGIKDARIEIREGDEYKPEQVQGIEIKVSLIEPDQNPFSSNVPRVLTTSPKGDNLIANSTPGEHVTEGYRNKKIRFSLTRKDDSAESHQLPEVTCHIIEADPEKTELVWRMATEIKNDTPDAARIQKTWYYQEKQFGYHPFEKENTRKGTTLPCICLQTNVIPLPKEATLEVDSKGDIQIHREQLGFAKSEKNQPFAQLNGDLKYPNQKVTVVATYKINGDVKQCRASLVFIDPRDQKRSGTVNDPDIATINYEPWYRANRSLRFLESRLSLKLPFVFNNEQYTVSFPEQNAGPSTRTRPLARGARNYQPSSSTNPIEQIKLDFQKDVLHLTIRYRTTEIESIKGRKRDEWCEANLDLQKTIKEEKEKSPPGMDPISENLKEKLQQAIQLFDPTSSENNLLERLEKFDTLLSEVLALKPRNWPKSEPKKPEGDNPTEKVMEKYRQEVDLHKKFKKLKRLHQDLKGKSNTLRIKTEEITTLIDPQLQIRFTEKGQKASKPIFEQSLQHTLEFRPHPRMTP